MGRKVTLIHFSDFTGHSRRYASHIDLRQQQWHRADQQCGSWQGGRHACTLSDIQNRSGILSDLLACKCGSGGHLRHLSYRGTSWGIGLFSIFFRCILYLGVFRAVFRTVFRPSEYATVEYTAVFCIPNVPAEQQRATPPSQGAGVGNPVKVRVARRAPRPLPPSTHQAQHSEGGAHRQAPMCRAWRAATAGGVRLPAAERLLKLPASRYGRSTEPCTLRCRCIPIPDPGCESPPTQ